MDQMLIQLRVLLETHHLKTILEALADICLDKAEYLRKHHSTDMDMMASMQMLEQWGDLCDQAAVDVENVQQG